jgi:putative transposase
MNILQQILTTTGIRKTQQTFLTTLLTLWLVIPGRINYANLARFAPQTEKTFRNWFAKSLYESYKAKSVWEQPWY